jgi:hypothetical protein
MPELAVFGTRGLKASEQEVSWKFGLSASLYPLTESMRVKFLVGKGFEECARFVGQLGSKAHRLHAS